MVMVEGDTLIVANSVHVAAARIQIGGDDTTYTACSVEWNTVQHKAQQLRVARSVLVWRKTVRDAVVVVEAFSISMTRAAIHRGPLILHGVATVGIGWAIDRDTEHINTDRAHQRTAILVANVDGVVAKNRGDGERIVQVVHKNLVGSGLGREIIVRAAGCAERTSGRCGADGYRGT